MATLSEDLRERTAMRYMGDCKCGKCQLVPRAVLDAAADCIEVLEAELGASNEEVLWLQARIETLGAALTLAANRLQRLVLAQPMGSQGWYEVAEWEREARAALPHP